MLDGSEKKREWRKVMKSLLKKMEKTMLMWKVGMKVRMKVEKMGIWRMKVRMRITRIRWMKVRLRKMKTRPWMTFPLNENQELCRSCRTMKTILLKFSLELSQNL